MLIRGDSPCKDTAYSSVFVAFLSSRVFDLVDADSIHGWRVCGDVALFLRDRLFKDDLSDGRRTSDDRRHQDLRKVFLRHELDVDLFEESER